MSYNDRMPAEQPWSFLPAISDAWNTPDLYTLENEILTKALQSSIAGGDFFSAGMPLHSKADASAATPSHTPTVSGVSSESFEALVSKQRRSLPPPSARIAKRNPRPSKRAAATTFIATDPENFMRMVQQVTGVSFDGDASLRFASVKVLKPVPRLVADGLPTLDTSAFLLDSSASSLLTSPPAAAAPPPSEHYLDSFCSFPTLESWSV